MSTAKHLPPGTSAFARNATARLGANSRRFGPPEGGLYVSVVSGFSRTLQESERAKKKEGVSIAEHPRNRWDGYYRFLPPFFFPPFFAILPP